jgi:hypothetical protein
MRTIVNSNSGLKTIVVTAAAVLLVAGIPVIKFANRINEKHTKEANSFYGSKIDVQYIGSNENSFTFNVKFENTTAQQCVLIIRDTKGKVIYSKRFNDVHFSDSIQIVKDEDAIYWIHPTFEIRVGKGDIERSFSIEKQLSDSVIVTKL